MNVGIEMISAGSGFAPAAGGMTTYYEGLSATLPEADGVSAVTAFMPPDAGHARITARPGLAIMSCDGLGNGRAQRVAYEHLQLPALVSDAGCEVLLCTHNVRPLRWRSASVVVLQSMQYFFLPDQIGRARRGYLRVAVPRSLRSADRVIAVSEAARRDAIELFELDPEQIVAVHHGCSPWASEAAAKFAREGTPPVPPPLDDGRPYIVIVSSLYGLKNHKRLIEAFAAVVAADGIDHHLAVAGREADVSYGDLQAIARGSGVEDRVAWLGAYPQESLPALLANADIVAYPSLYETFGHPVLEAFAFGRPLLTSDRGGAAEVAGDAAVTVDPEDVESIADGLRRLIADQELRAELLERSRRRLLDFSWERCAAGTAAALRSALDRRGS